MVKEKQKNNWFWADILRPFLFSRCWLLLVGWLAQYFPLNLNYPVLPRILARGWQFSPWRFLDIWARWDASWYFTIIKHGYWASGSLTSVQSNLAFSPLYPYLVKFFLMLVPSFLRTNSVILFIGVLISNFFLVCSLILLYRFVMEIFQDSSLARRVVWYLLLFPTSFYLSAFFPESTYLFFAILTFYFAGLGQWLLAGLGGFLVTLSRPNGILIFIPILWFYFETISWKLRNLKLNILWLLLIPAGFLVFLGIGYFCTGDFLASVKIQQAWGRHFTLPGQTFFSPNGYYPFLTLLEQVFTLIFLILSILSFWFLPSVSFGLFSFLSLMIVLFSGRFTSSLRFYTVLFPVFLMMAVLGKNKLVDKIIMVTFLIIQILLMIAWSQFYWVA